VKAVLTQKESGEETNRPTDRQRDRQVGAFALVYDEDNLSKTDVISVVTAPLSNSRIKRSSKR